jgi:hypothetical protein
MSRSQPHEPPNARCRVPAAPTFVDRVHELAERYGADVGRLADSVG